ncbi:MAG: segregation/condensation protein A [Actinobacteria bacterium]|nr:segregation/condensation protein A [Actinomycetota bacterium]
MPYDVVTPVYSGPFDLLLHLITKDEVELWDVQLSVIVDAFVAELELMKGLDLDVATDFLLTAAVLVELKTRRLLPGRADADLDEELALWEERDLLIARLLECKTFKDAARAFEKLSDRAGLALPRTSGIEEAFLGIAPDLLAGITPAQLAAAFGRAAEPKPIPTVDLEHVAPIRLSVSEAVAGLVTTLPHRGPTTFRSLAGEVASRLEVIVTFLALLELYKQGLIELGQEERFSMLSVVWIGGDDPDAVADLLVEDYQG